METIHVGQENREVLSLFFSAEKIMIEPSLWQWIFECSKLGRCWGVKITNDIGNKIDRVFNYVFEKGINFQGKEGKRLNSSATKTYANVVKAYNNWLEKNHGISIDRAKPRHAYEYIDKKVADFKNGQGSAYTIRKIPHALHAFQEASSMSKVFNHKCKVADKTVIKATLDSNNVYRKSANSNRLIATKEDYNKVMDAMSQSRSMYKNYARDIHEAQRQLGLRVHEGVKMQVRDIDFKNGIVRVIGKGGLERFVEVKDKQYLVKLKGFCVGKKGGADVFRTQNKKGDPPSRERREQIVKELIKTAAERAGVNRNGKNYSSHSGRNGYAQQEVNALKQLSKRQIEAIHEKMCRENKKVAQKSKEALRNIRSKIKNPEKRKEREFTKRELVLYIVSCWIGHFRLDVMRYYARY